MNNEDGKPKMFEELSTHGQQMGDSEEKQRMKKVRLQPVTVEFASSQDSNLDGVKEANKGTQRLLEAEPSSPPAASELPPFVETKVPNVRQGIDKGVEVDSATSAKCAHELLAKDRQRHDMLAVLHNVTQAVTSCRNLEEILQCIVQAATSLLGSDAASIRLLDSSNGECGLEAANGLAAELDRVALVSPQMKPAGWIVSKQLPLIISDMQANDDLNVRELANRENVVGYIGVPLMLRGKSIGLIEVYARSNSRRFTRRDILRLTALGNQAAIAIENSRLYQTERDTVTKLQQLERHKSDFMAMVAHELRTPLTSIKGFAQLLQRQNACANGEAAERYLNIIEAESNRMIGIINDILDISKMEAGLLQMCKQPLSMYELIDAVVDSAGYLSRGHILEVNVSQSLPLIRGDAAKIGQVLINLISNAVKYSPENEPIQIGATSDDEGVTVWVNDRGRGIPVDKFDHIFNKYKIAEGDKEQEKSRSSGLGLYISKNFVEAHGGKMWVESEEGKGAKFLFKLYY